MKSVVLKLRLFIYVICISHVSVRSTALNNEYDVIIVGAGPAGIAAASRLLFYGISNFVVLEAENITGGRINSVEFGNAVVDLGAEFSTKDEQNVVYTLGKDFLSEGSNDFDMVHSNGEIIDKSLSKQLYDFVGLYEKLDRNASDPYETIGDYFLKKYNEIIIRQYEADENQLQICKDALGTLESCVCYLEGSFDWFKPALNSPYEKSSENVEWNLNWNGRGFKTVLKLMMDQNIRGEEQITNKILLNKEVTKILWGEELKTVEVMCEDGTIFKAAHLIFTPSVGVMKTYKDIFSPKLSDQKNDCIEKLGFDAIFKVHAHFPQKWWPDNFTYQIFVWSEKERQSLIEQFPTAPVKNGTSWVGSIYHIHPAAVNNPNVLGIWITGGIIPDLEATPINEIQDGIGFAIQKFLGKTYDVVPPDQIIHSSWFTNPHFHGSYSYDTPDSLRLGYDCHEILAQPVLDNDSEPRLLFAGEATESNHYSTVHGAIETDYREARRLAIHYAKVSSI